MPQLEHKPLGQLLLTKGMVKAEQIERALETQRLSNHEKLLGEVLVELQVCNEDQITEALADAYEVPFARVNPKIVDAKIFALLPRDFLEKHQVVPLFLVEGTLTVAMTEPANIFLIEEVERVAGYPVQVVAATARDIRATLAAYVPNSGGFVLDDLSDDAKTPSVTLIERPKLVPPAPEQISDASPAAKLINHCLHHAVKDGANEIHIEPGENSLRVRQRVDGRLVEKIRSPSGMGPAIAARLKILAGLDAAQLQSSQEGTFNAVVDKRPVELRIVTAPSRFGEKIVIHLAEHERTTVSLEKLGFGYDTLKQWRTMLTQSTGLLLVAGPVDCGKTATLYASLQERNVPEANLCTIEDPIEYALPGVNQFQVNAHSDFTYTAVLESVVRQGPDVVMIDELRDPRIAQAAIALAMKGRLVLSTLPTNDAPSAITRLYNFGIEPYLVGASLCGVLAQRLLRKLCQVCKEPFTPTVTDRRLLDKFGGSVETLYRAKGCPRCQGLGYRGRIGAYELLVMDETLTERISQGIALPSLRELAEKSGMKTLRTDGIDKVKAGITTIEEVFRVMT